jgi:hypothetical protein
MARPFFAVVETRASQPQRYRLLIVEDPSGQTVTLPNGAIQFSTDGDLFDRVIELIADLTKLSPKDIKVHVNFEELP